MVSRAELKDRYALQKLGERWMVKALDAVEVNSAQKESSPDERNSRRLRGSTEVQRCVRMASSGGDRCRYRGQEMSQPKKSELGHVRDGKKLGRKRQYLLRTEDELSERQMNAGVCVKDNKGLRRALALGEGAGDVRLVKSSKELQARTTS
jgi:hypothetical protein